ncbi:Crp/Fnr family transcriptional regulator [Flavipsychrobacter stenotrophus]|uniref:Crp/Fnr family transcriptional regulator n=1 Tax=Flavipsychrobacter stenotrophus TaxID=2077091 RepID=A0A2S7SYK5_9BACT|nr:Crp/Fnr family transcriptional regulator [Flavipsychrobacter stenotrophus]PQJ12002.1 Crp/Fnr family transcriptional regulator [Flavipsychrobacter stenotrophus]
MNNSIFTDPALLAEISRVTRTKSIAKDEVLMSPGDKIVFIPIVQSGVLRIIRENDEGKEIFLYHLYPGQTCAMAINCCQAHKESAVRAVAEDDTEVLLIPVDMVEHWMKYDQWKTFVNSTYSQRFAELIEVIDLIAFNNMDKQVMHYLNERARATGSNTLAITHQQVADELHTHREAVSRLLRTMEQKELVKLGRNTIELI